MTITYFDKPRHDNYAYPDGEPLRVECEIKHAGTTAMKMLTVMDDAKAIVCADRHDAYGPPEINHARTAKLWSVFLGIDITPRQVCFLNILQKCAREVNIEKRDNLVDIIGYAANAEACTDGY